VDLAEGDSHGVLSNATNFRRSAAVTPDNLDVAVD
jgi:hypothetical protein